MKLAEFFKDGTGSYSATRLAFILWSCGVLAVWIVESVSKGVLQPVDNTVMTILGILMTGKVVQSFSPNDASPTTPPAK